MQQPRKTRNQAWECLSQAVQIMAPCHMILHSSIDIIAEYTIWVVFQPTLTTQFPQMDWSGLD